LGFISRSGNFQEFGLYRLAIGVEEYLRYVFLANSN